MKSLFWALILLFIEAALVLCFVSPDHANEQIEKESTYIARDLGHETAEAVSNDAHEWYDRWIRANRVEEAVHDFFIPTKEQKARSRGLENLGDPVFPIVESRIEAFFDMLFWMLRRLSLFLMWLPMMAPILILSLADGWLKRRIKQQTFEYASPFWHKNAFHAAVVASTILITLFFVPYAVDPSFAPCLLAITGILCGLAMSNIQKRI